MDNITAARHARKKARTSATNAKLHRSWKRWELFFHRIDYSDDEFLDGIDESGHIRLPGAFAQAIRQRDFSRSGTKDLAAATCEEAVDKVAEAFRANNRRDLHHGPSNIKDDNLRL